MSRKRKAPVRKVYPDRSRSVWNWGLAFLILETVGWVQIIRGAFGDLAASARERIAQIEGTIAFREKQLQAALEAGSEKVAVYKRTIESLEGTIGGIRAEAVQAEEQGITIMLAGLLVLLGVKFAQVLRFKEWELPLLNLDNF